MEKDYQPIYMGHTNSNVEPEGTITTAKRVLSGRFREPEVCSCGLYTRLVVFKFCHGISLVLEFLVSSSLHLLAYQAFMNCCVVLRL